MLEESNIMLDLGTVVVAVGFRRSKFRRSPFLPVFDPILRAENVKGYTSVDELRLNGPAVLEWTEEALEQPVFLTKSRLYPGCDFSSD
jgi:hypothetical protein